jgi:hypothetical protein
LSDAPDISDGENTLIYDRYELIRELGKGGQATTWLAHDLVTEEQVALKELALDRVVDWKSVELFEREGQALASIDHPQVPDFIDAFHIEADGERSRFFLAQEYVSGQPLAERIEHGARMDVDEAVSLLEDLLSVLAYLHDRSPPIIHRDIKPSNILLDDDGNVVLVDFGAVQLVLPNTMGGSTIVGTTGFFPMEQLMGKAVPASDLYAAGATMVHLMSGKHPAEIDMERNRLTFEPHVSAPEWFVSFLRRLLEPAAEDRFEDAGEALSFFEQLRDSGGVEQVADHENAVVTVPKDEWLEVSAGRVLVDDRATDETIFRIECADEATLSDGTERRPGHVELALQPDRAELTFETGPASTPMTRGNIATAIGVCLLLVVPLPVPVRLTAFIFGASALALYLTWRYRPKSRHVDITSKRIAIHDGDGSTDFLLSPGESRFEARGSDMVLVSEHGDEPRVAGGMGEERARWLAAKLERVRGQLADKRQIDLEVDDRLIDRE